MTIDDTEAVETPKWARRWAVGTWAVVAFMLTPIVVTALYPVTPDDAPAWWIWPFAVVAVLAVGLGWRGRGRRVVAAAIVVSEVVWFGFLWWMLTTIAEFD